MEHPTHWAGPGPEGLERPGQDGAPPIGARSPKELVPRSEGAARPFTLPKGLRETPPRSSAVEALPASPQREGPETLDAGLVGRASAAEGRARLSRGR